MAYTASSIPNDHSEFGGGPGMIDPQRRADRVLEGHEELWEIHMTNPAAASALAGDLDGTTAGVSEDLSEVPVPRTLTGLL